MPYAPAIRKEILPGTGNMVVSPPAYATAYATDFTSGRHLGGVNMCYADGHVKWQRSSTVFQEAVKYNTAPVNSVPNAWSPTNPD